MTNIIPILVTVKDGRWESRGLTDTPTERDLALAKFLNDMGGVSETVPEGDHYFNVIEKDGQTQVHLVQIPDPQ